MHVPLLSFTGVVYCATCGATLAAQFESLHKDCRAPTICTPTAPEEHPETESPYYGTSSRSPGITFNSSIAVASVTATPVYLNLKPLLDGGKQFDGGDGVYTFSVRWSPPSA